MAARPVAARLSPSDLPHGLATPRRRGSVRLPVTVSAPSSLEPNEVDELLQARELDRARAALESADPGDRRFDVVRIKLSLYDGSLPAHAAVQELIKIMRRQEDFPGARELYQEASDSAYAARQSSVAHSHPPPPVRGTPDSKA
jgi:hypothetical protein